MRSFLDHWLIPRLGSFLIMFLSKSLRWRMVNIARMEEMERQNRYVIYAFWHNRLILMPYIKRRFHKANGLAVMVSQSKDGQIIAGILDRLDIKAIRGSTTRGGKTALREMVKFLKSGSFGAFTPDGPRGPRYEVGPGIAVLARLTGLPIVPVCWDATRKIVLRSWDKMMIPMPFARTVYVVGDPIEVGKDATPNVLQEKILEIKTALGRLADRCELELTTKVACETGHPALKL